MKLSGAISSLVLSIGLSNNNHATDAFAPRPILVANNNIYRTATSTTTSTTTTAAGRKTFMSTTADNETATTSSTTTVETELNDDFQKSMDDVVTKLASALNNPIIEGPLKHFTTEYFHACQAASLSGVESITAASTAKNMMDALQYGMKFGLGESKYQFGSTHTALRGSNGVPEEEDGNTIDFYEFGCNFFRPAMDLQNSLVLDGDGSPISSTESSPVLTQIRSQLEAGENVVLFANHQSEADPQVMSCLLEKVDMEPEAEKLVYVAGHKVTTDALAIPFSMGRNLICIHSKKHIDADIDTKPLKMKQNLAAMSGMLGKLKKGGTMIWVAPSGGRDRRDLETGNVPIAPFDQKTIDMFRLMGNKSKVQTHYYAVSMVSYDLCPPPDFVEAGVGEQRNVRFVPVGISVSDELENVGGVESRHLFTENAFKACQKGYDDLLEQLQ